jgi:hypothetical protein
MYSLMGLNLAGMKRKHLVLLMESLTALNLVETMGSRMMKRWVLVGTRVRCCVQMMAMPMEKNWAARTGDYSL